MSFGLATQSSASLNLSPLRAGATSWLLLEWLYELVMPCTEWISQQWAPIPLTQAVGTAEHKPDHGSR